MEIPEVIEKRIYPRIKLQEPVQYRQKDPSLFGGCLGADISKSGLKVYFNQFLSLNTPLWLTVELTSEKIIEVAGRVVWIAKFPHNERYAAGIEFDSDEILPFIQRNIHHWMYQQNP